MSFFVLLTASALKCEPSRGLTSIPASDRLIVVLAAFLMVINVVVIIIKLLAG